MSEKTPRADKLKNQTAIIKEIIKDPMQSQRDIAEKVGTSVSTVNEHIKEIPKANKTERIEKILDKDLSIVDLALEEIERRIKEEKEKMTTRDMISAADVSAKRYSLLKGTATDEDGGLKEGTLNQKQIDAIDALSNMFK